MLEPEYTLIHRFLTPEDITKFLQYIDMLVESDYQPGRLGSGYEKVNIKAWTDDFFEMIKERARRTITSKPIKTWDAWLICMPDSSWINPHVDICSGEHHRLNACIQSSDRGGAFSIEGQQVVIPPGCAIVFRPDLMRHEVSMAVGKPRWMLSVGVAV